MTGRAGQVEGDELWVRCWVCGDSDRDPEKAHMSIRNDGLYHCYRCNAGGRLSPKHLISIVYSDKITLGVPELELPRYNLAHILEELMPGPGTRRFSALDRYHLVTSKEIKDVFLSRDQYGGIIGVAVVGAGNRKIYGRKGLGWKGDYLVSEPDSPLRLVEGPFDCLSERYVCSFGLPSISTLRFLRGHYLIIVPDSDVWKEQRKRWRMLELLRWAKKNRDPIIIGVELIDEGDPDEVPEEEREFVGLEEMLDGGHSELQQVLRDIRTEV